MNQLEFQQARLNSIVKIINGNFKAKIAVILEGRDSAGKSGTIRELTHFLPLNDFRVMTTKKPTKGQMTAWFTWWENRLPKDNSPLISFYDRSWYSRALVQRVNQWCTEKQYANFMARVLDFETADPDTIVIKFWLSISQEEQFDRLTDRKTSPLRGWKYSNNDARALTGYDKMTLAKEQLFNSVGQDWNVIDYNNKEKGRIDLLSKLNSELVEIFDIDTNDIITENQLY